MKPAASDAYEEVNSRYLLASGSRYRAELLQRLQQPFLSSSPDIDETVQRNEDPADLACRLARQKALAVAGNQALKLPANLVIIASDQVASLGSRLLGKPGSAEAAHAQLQAMSKQQVMFHTSLHMLKPGQEAPFTALDTTTVVFRALHQTEIERYVAREQPFDCAGSFKVEALGISLFDAVNSKDPTALIGLPMIAVCQGLRHFGIDVP